MLEPISYIELLIKGIIVGIVVSAPMGPVGILCVQRTINKGRWYGLVTGLGAMLSDIIYALLTGYGMSFMSHIIDRNLLYFQLGGSVMLFLFGVWAFTNKPKPHDNKNKGKGTYTHNFITAFLVTLSNPLIIFLFVGLFARFAPAGRDSLFFEQFSSYLAVAAGCVLWWFLLTAGITRLRSRFNDNSLCLINRIIGIVVCIASIAGVLFTLKIINL